MAKKKRHHYVPQFYLNGFIDLNNPPFIWVYDKQENKVFKVKAENIAYEKHYYTFDLPDGGKDTESFENISEDFVRGYLSNKIVTIISGGGQRPQLIDDQILWSAVPFFRALLPLFHIYS